METTSNANPQTVVGLGSTVLLGWIACSEKLPDEDTPVLIVLDGEIRMGELRRKHPSWEETWQSYEFWDDPTNEGMDWDWESITHWMPLPALPNRN
jgi:hypothetical protein